jgi:glycine/D-amino acid oxidase-like deaminating enzyme
VVVAVIADCPGSAYHGRPALEVAVPFARTASRRAETMVAGAARVPFWSDGIVPPEPSPSWEGTGFADLVVIGAGYSGLWTALLAKERDPSRDVVLLEGRYAGRGASGRNAGLCQAALTRDPLRLAASFPEEFGTVSRLGADNLDEIERFVRQHGIDCGFDRVGGLTVATDAHHLDQLDSLMELAEEHGVRWRRWDGPRARDLLHSPRYQAAIEDPTGLALVDPVRLGQGLRRVCLDRGVRLYERTPVTGMVTSGRGMLVHTARGRVRARTVALTTNAFPPLLRRLRYAVVPRYHYTVVTEPLTDRQRADLGWAGRQGARDAGNQFHYYRLTPDGRILFGGYDMAYHRGSGVGARFEDRPEVFALLAEHLLEVFPQLEGITITHAWGGTIDASARSSPFWGTARAGRVGYVAGFSGLGLGVSRFAAQTLLDLLDRHGTERTGLGFVRARPGVYPPEPWRSLGINLTRWSLRRADHHEGHRNLWLRTMDRTGPGFSS